MEHSPHSGPANRRWECQSGRRTAVCQCSQVQRSPPVLDTSQNQDSSESSGTPTCQPTSSPTDDRTCVPTDARDSSRIRFASPNRADNVSGPMNQIECPLTQLPNRSSPGSFAASSRTVGEQQHLESRVPHAGCLPTFLSEHSYHKYRHRHYYRQAPWHPHTVQQCGSEEGRKSTSHHISLLTYRS